MQFGVMNIIAQHPDVLKTFGNFIVQKFIHKNEEIIEKT